MISLGFWFLGRTDIAKAYIYPTLIVGSLLVLVGLGLFYSNYARLSSLVMSLMKTVKHLYNQK